MVSLNGKEAQVVCPNTVGELTSNLQTYIIFVADAADIICGAILLHMKIVDGHVEQKIK